MKLFEMVESEVGYQSVKDDNSQPRWKESRKTKLTLKQIRKLRQMNDVRNYEKTLHLKELRKQYGASAESQNTPSL